MPFFNAGNILKWNLFAYRKLQQWLDQLLMKPSEPQSLQLEFAF